MAPFPCVFLVFATFLLTEAKDTMTFTMERMICHNVAQKNASVKGWLSHYNRTTKVINMDLIFFKKPAVNMTVNMNVLKFLSNEYRQTSCSFNLTMPTVLSPSHITYTDMGRLFTECSRPPMTSWPPKVNVTYRMRNWIPKLQNLPPAIPSGNYKFVMTNYEGKNRLDVLFKCELDAIIDNILF